MKQSAFCSSMDKARIIIIIKKIHVTFIAPALPTAQPVAYAPPVPGFMIN